MVPSAIQIEKFVRPQPHAATNFAIRTLAAFGIARHIKLLGALEDGQDERRDRVAIDSQQAHAVLDYGTNQRHRADIGHGA